MCAPSSHLRKHLLGSLRGDNLESYYLELDCGTQWAWLHHPRGLFLGLRVFSDRILINEGNRAQEQRDEDPTLTAAPAAPCHSPGAPL